MADGAKKFPDILPVLPVKNSVIFPRMIVPLVLKEEEHLQLVDDALKNQKMLLVAMARPIDEAEKSALETYRIGTVAQAMKLSKAEEGTVLVLQGLARVTILEVVSEQPYKRVRVRELKEVVRSGKEITALTASIESLFKQIVAISPHLPDELVPLSRNVDQPGALADLIASTLNLDGEKKQQILETLDIKERLKKLALFLTEELELQRMGKKIQDQVKEEIDKSQREYYLREQLKAIQAELGMGKEPSPEILELKQKLEAKDLPDTVRAAAEKEIERLSMMNSLSPEYHVSRTYLDWILELPWNEGTQDRLDLKVAERVLDRDHYDLEKVKKRILEYLAVRKLNPAHKGPILCLVGPPGTGKTSLGRSIADALGRKFVRMSLGGIRDEAEIRGHRRTYVGALPGRIVQWIKKAGANNPVFMLDEVDKIGSDFRGDPSSALLEVLDPEQNSSFSDHYLELEFDLSKVMFICTSNQLDPIPGPLLDRMEVLELAGYTEDEKLHIAEKFLIPRQISEHGLNRKRVSFRRSALRKIIREYTREAGVRNLERQIGSICRAIARKVAGGARRKFVITDREIRPYLGNPVFAPDTVQRSSVPGVATGLAWTPSGGDILFVEATMMPGQKSLVLTGQLGDVMKESAHAALSFLRTNASQLGIPSDFYKHHDLHIHVPAGAIPKDGPSAGVTILAALASLLTSTAIRPKLAMTGEVTLRGAVLPVGGIKEKLLAASRSGIKEIILPAGNKNDLDDLPEKVKKQLRFHWVTKMDQVLDLALNSTGKASSRNRGSRKQGIRTKARARNSSGHR